MNDAEPWLVTIMREHGHCSRRLVVALDIDFVRTRDDLVAKPSPVHSLDRIRNEEGYNCGRCRDCQKRKVGANCRWASRHEQGRNRRTNRLVRFRDKTLCIAAWAEQEGIPARILKGRLRRGWTMEKALTTPIKERDCAK